MDSRYKDTGLLFLSIAVILISGCIGGEGKKETLSIAGSTTVQPIASNAAEEFMKKNPDVIVSVQGGGSGTGIKM
ncbi:MAG TPA: phosphate-binding protein, partial [Candidatus Altiarchaeales archaeon]|nr:phosphate-binding protein [Candidatus Altiarchaeales archaeon]